MKNEYILSIKRSLIYIFEIILVIGGITYFSLIIDIPLFNGLQMVFLQELFCLVRWAVAVMG